jgi:hypothetical protein
MARILVSLVVLNLWSKLQTLREDGFADMRGEYEESEGQQVLRHLKGIVAWHAAAVGLLDGPFRRDVTQRLVVGLVEVTPNELKPLADEEVIQEYFRRYQTKLLLSPTLIEMADDRQQTAKESKGIRNRLKKAFGLGSRSTPQSRSNSPSTVVASPVVTPAPPPAASHTCCPVVPVPPA